MKKKLVFGTVLFLFVGLLFACGKGEELKLDSKQKEESTEKKDSQSQDSQQSDKSNQKAGDAEMAVYPQLSLEVAENERLVQMNTNMGSIKIKLFPEAAPKTVENFITHAKDGYYNGIIFHRVINEFMIQGGDPTGTGMGGESIYGDAFEDEFTMTLFNIRGALSMANAGPNTNGSQFFIVQKSDAPATAEQLKNGGWPEEIAKAYEENGGTPHLDQKHTVFGQVIEGMDVVDKIANVETARGDKPVDDVVIESIDILK
ncbi:peptidylprolyl isomerase [Lederbergia graminis]|uniref:Peptidyl-prolyl cis-trans isomerase n=1 Tax=Lederbergia graminis TaxID=735518 RepID=A0ABW0LH37_9BACI